MGHYLFNFAKKGAAKGRTLREQAAELLEVEMWGIGAKAPNRTSLAPGDRILIYVGAPEYEFIGHAELGSAAHEWSSEEMARYPGSFDSGVIFSQAETWPHPISVKSLLPQLGSRRRIRVRASSQASSASLRRTTRRWWPSAPATCRPQSRPSHPRSRR